MTSCPHRKIRPVAGAAVGDLHVCVDVFRRSGVVVQSLPEEAHEGSEAAVRFQREARLMSGANFDGVIKVEHFGSDEYGRTWMAMEFVDGVSPAGAIGEGDTWGVHRLMVGIGRSLDELHGLGVVHRDLKPDNVLLRNDPQGWEPVIIDLGIAKWLAHEAATATGSVFGTPHYMSPEQFRDTKHVGPATDRYALAVIGFELLSGRLPYDGRNLPELLHQHMESEIPPLQLTPRRHDTNATVAEATEPSAIATPQLDAFMRRAMAKTPAARYGSGREMAAAFRTAATADGVWHEPTMIQPLFEPLAQPVVELRYGSSPPSRFDMREGPVVIGRHEACQFVVGSPRMSRLHACLYAHRGRVWVADLQSQNGTQYGGRQLAVGVPVPLRVDAEPAVLRLYDQDVALRSFEG